MTARTLLLGTVAAVALGGVAQAEPFHGWYVGIEGGANWVSPIDQVQQYPSGAKVNQTFDLDVGWGVFGTIGRTLGDHWRVEAEVGYRKNNIGKFTGTHGTHVADVNGTDSEFTLMANVVYDLMLGDRWSLSVGAGAGADRAHTTSKTFGFDDSEWSFAYQGLVGVNYKMGERSALFANFRYLVVNGFDYSDASLPQNGVVHQRDINKETLTLGLRFALQPQEEAAPPPPPTPPPPPATVPKQFVIFFGFNKCNITSEADAVLGEAASAAKSYGSASVEIVGHTDTVGSPKYNQRLSECRANAAATNLESKGVPAGAIHSSGVGESDLLIQTGDGVKEPQNRRDTINLR